MKASVVWPGILCLLLASCQRSADFGGQAIETVGRFPCFQNQLVIEVEHTSDGRFKYTVRRNSAAFGTAAPSFQRASHWLILSDSQDSVWVYDGERDVTHIELYPDGGAKFSSQQKVPDLLSRAPAGFVSRLPAELKSS